MKIKLLSIIFLSSFLIMILEIIGGKFLIPFFGSSHIIWITQILITLISLSVGSLISIKFNENKHMAFMLRVSSLNLILTIHLVPKLISYLSNYPLLVQNMIISSLLYSLPLISLSMIYPILTKELNKLTVNFGIISFWGTIGSVIGTLITYFIIILFSNYHVLLLTGSFILLLSYIIQPINYKKIIIHFLILLMILNYFNKINFVDPNIVLYKNSHFGELTLIKEKNNLVLYNDQVVQNGFDLNKNSIHFFTYVLSNLPKQFHNNIKKVLILGLGLGLAAKDFEKTNTNVTAIEINPEMISLSKQYINLQKTKIIEGDSRTELLNLNESFDLIIHDCFLIDSVPKHLLTKEFFHSIKTKLNKNGLLIINSFGKVNPNDYITDATYNTLKTIFNHVKIYSINEFNVFFLASDSPLIPLSSNIPENIGIYNKKYEQLLKNKINDPKKTIIMSDDSNPIEFYDTLKRELYRNKKRESKLPF